MTTNTIDLTRAAQQTSDSELSPVRVLPTGASAPTTTPRDSNTRGGKGAPTDLVWVDFTASYQWGRPPTGITRVEQECARWLLGAAADRVRFCAYDGESQQWKELPHTVVGRVLAGEYETGGESNDAADANDAHAQTNTSPFVQFQPGDIYVCLNADQTPERLQAMFEARQRGVRIVGIAYDIIQVLYPHFYWPQADQGCARYFVDLAWAANHIYCISRRTQEDLLSFYREVGAPVPAMSLVRLGDNVPQVSGELSPQVQRILEQPFILVVGTVEIRKNHEVLYRAVLDLLERQQPLPLLVFAGMRGWRVDDLLQSLEHDARVRQRIVLLSHASDVDIDALYRRCLFTVFPSYYEGWGLPVAESLAYGKFCIASNAGAIPEVGGDLTELLSPYDVRAWADALWRYATDRQLLQQREQAIRAGYRTTPWQTAAAAMMQPVLTGDLFAQG